MILDAILPVVAGGLWLHLQIHRDPSVKDNPKFTKEDNKRRVDDWIDSIYGKLPKDDERE